MSIRFWRRRSNSASQRSGETQRRNIFQHCRSAVYICAVILLAACSESDPNHRPLESDSTISEPQSAAIDTSDDGDIVVIDTNITHTVQFRTDLGKFTIGAYGKDAPKTVQNFVKLAAGRFFNGMRFHRIAKDFVIQTGDPNSKQLRKREEWGAGGRSWYGEPFEDELDSTSTSFRDGYKRGTVAMANNGPNTNTSQFFICLKDVPELEKKFTIFGRVIVGLEVIDSIAAGEIEPIIDPTDGRPLDPVKIRWVRIKTLQR